MADPEEILNFWFYEVGPERWFAEDPALDATIRERYLAVHERAALEELREQYKGVRDDIKNLKPMQILSELEYFNLSSRFGQVFCFCLIRFPAVCSKEPLGPMRRMILRAISRGRRSSGILMIGSIGRSSFFSICRFCIPSIWATNGLPFTMSAKERKTRTGWIAPNGGMTRSLASGGFPIATRFWAERAGPKKTTL